jgi:hypothetical protein
VASIPAAASLAILLVDGLRYGSPLAFSPRFYGVQEAADFRGRAGFPRGRSARATRVPSTSSATKDCSSLAQVSRHGASEKESARVTALHRYGNTAVIERFIKSPKDEWLRRLIIPLRFEALRKDLSAYTSWFNEHRPHQALDGCTSREIYERVVPLNQVGCCDLRPTCTAGKHDAVSGLRFTLAVTYHEGRRHLPIIELKRAA